MAYEEALQVHTEIAGADLSAAQFVFVQLASDGQVDPAGAGAHSVGVLQDKPDAAGKDALVAHGGISKVRAGAALATIGTPIASDANGKAVAAVTGDVVHGFTREAAGAEDEIISCSLFLNSYIEPV